MGSKKKVKNGPPRRRAPRHSPNLEEVLDETIRMLDMTGESGFRIEELMAAVRVSKSSLYLNFTDRDGLIAAARARQFERIVNESVDGIRQLAASVSTRSEIRTALSAATAFTQSITRHQERMRRVAIVAGTVGRPDYQKQLAEAQTRLTDALEEIIRVSRERGLISTRHSDRTIAMFLQSYTLGRVLAGFDLKRSKNDDVEWTTLIDDVTAHIFFVD